MEASTLRTLCELAYAKAGISLNETKEPLVAARVAKRLRALRLSSEEEYVRLLKSSEGQGELVHFLDAISTNFTSFFREEAHFEELAGIVAASVAEGQRKLRLWSCASSSGEEPYSMAITVQEAIAGTPVDYRILATDISTRMLSTAREGVYNETQIARVPRHLRTRYFSKVRGQNGGDFYGVSSDIRQHVSFARLNLSSPPFPMKGPFDVVFCRNVMIYFDQRVRQELVGDIERILAPCGYLIVGHSETLNGVSTRLRSQRVTIYRKPMSSDSRSGVPPHDRNCGQSAMEGHSLRHS